MQREWRLLGRWQAASGNRWERQIQSSRQGQRELGKSRGFPGHSGWVRRLAGYT